MTKPFLFSLGLLGLGPVSPTVDGYVCAAKHSSGFRFDASTKEWHSTTFRTDEQYVVAVDSRANSWIVKRLGTDITLLTCPTGFDSGGWLECRGVTGRFDLQNKTLRFMYSYTFGYIEPYPIEWNGKVYNEGSDTPRMEIGICSPI